MRSIPIVFISYLVLIGTVMLYMSKPTDADLLDKESVEDNLFSAVTLDLNNLDTANQMQKSVLFSMQGLVPTGFAVESVRFKNSGSQTMKYELGFQQTAGEAEACTALYIKVLRNWSVVQSGKLSEVSASGELSENETSDLVLAIGLDASDASLQNKSCLFNLVVSAIAKDATEKVVFSDEEVLQNQVIFGSWSTP